MPEHPTSRYAPADYGLTPVAKRADEEKTPLYEKVKRQLSQKILFGEWPEGTVLPAEGPLAGQMGVAIGTLRRALQDLANEGLVTRRRKAGTVVTGRTHHYNLTAYFQYFRLHGQEERPLHSKAHNLEVGLSRPSSRVAQVLRLAPGEKIIFLRRRRDIDGRPVIHDVDMLPARLTPGFPLDLAAIPERLHLFLYERYGLRIAAVREYVRSALATAQDRRILRLRAPAALLTIDEIAYDGAGNPLAYAQRRATTREHVYINEIT